MTGDGVGMAVHVDEARGDHPPGYVERSAADDRLGRDRAYDTSGDSHLGDTVEPCLGIEDATTAQHEVVEPRRDRVI
ncbi:hypothetical protein GCM10023205_19430 [Yinghuangia aomiensis]|uniref:Uncharacterized protein n=1 Tax=Yinghuangia aomiensis TaxID=676205 RepID=A0ABP9GZ43_9ACTN